MKYFLLILLVLILIPCSNLFGQTFVIDAAVASILEVTQIDQGIAFAQMIADNIDDSFYFVLEKLIRLEGYFIDVADDVARVVLLIAVLTAALNQILTGKGLKEGLIQTMKAFIFFSVIAFAYPRVIVGKKIYKEPIN